MMKKVTRKEICYIVFFTILIILVILFSLLYEFIWKVPTYEIVVQSNIENKNIIQGGGNYSKGEIVTISASKIDGYTFVNWTFNDSEVSNEYEYSFMVDESNYGTYIANYLLRDLKIHVFAENGSVEIQNTAKYGDIVSIQNIIPNKGYILDEIYFIENNSSEKIFVEQDTFIMPSKNISIYINFIPLTYSIKINDNIEHGTISLSYLDSIYNNKVNVFYYAQQGYKLKELYYISLDGQEKFEITGDFFLMPDFDIIIFAEFEIEEYHIICNLNGGTIDEFQTYYNINSNTIVIPQPTREGYIFVGWIGEGISVACKDFSIPYGSTGDVELFALWVKE